MKLHAGVSSEAAVDGQDNAGDSGSELVVGQEQHAAQQLVGVNETAGGSTGQDLGGTGGGGAVLVEQQSAVLVGHDEAGSDGVAADAGAGEVGSQPLGEVGDGSLGAGVSGDLGQGDISVHGGDVQDVAGLALNHVLGEDLSGQQGALEVQLEQEVDAGLIQIEEGLLAFLGLVLVLVVGGSTGVVAAGAVDQDVAGTEVSQDLLMNSLQSLQLQNVGLVALHDEALSGDFLSQLQDSSLVQVQSSDLSASLSISAGHIAAQNAASAGDDDDLTGKIMGQGKIQHSRLPPK